VADEVVGVVEDSEVETEEEDSEEAVGFHEAAAVVVVSDVIMAQVDHQVTAPTVGILVVEEGEEAIAVGVMEAVVEVVTAVGVEVVMVVITTKLPRGELTTSYRE